LSPGSATVSIQEALSKFKALGKRTPKVVLLVGDGAFIYCCPTAALWAASFYNAPHLTVIFNNGEYRALRGIWPLVYGGDSFSEKTGEWVGVDFTPCPDYTLIAQACGAYGQRVEEPSELKPVIRKALGIVHGGQAAVLDVIIEKGL